jgi:hypothetical protein
MSNNLANLPKKKSAVMKGLASHLKYCYGACVKKIGHCQQKSYQKRYSIFWITFAENMQIAIPIGVMTNELLTTTNHIILQVITA